MSWTRSETPPVLTHSGPIRDIAFFLPPPWLVEARAKILHESNRLVLEAGWMREDPAARDLLRRATRLTDQLIRNTKERTPQ